MYIKQLFATPKNFSSATLIILSITLMFTAISCGSSGTSTTSNAPVANAGGPYVGNVNQALGFNGSASTAPSGKSLTSFAWLFGDGSSGTGASTAHTYTTAGNFTATLTVTDSSGTTASSSVAVQIITAPVARPGGPYTGKVGTAVSFNGSASTAPPGQALGFSWNFGDGSTGSGATPSHTYGSACTCTITLTVTDDTAGTSIANTTATIAAGPGAGGESATPSIFFAIGPAANASSQFSYVLTTSASGATSLAIETIDNATGNLQSTNVAPPSLDSNFVPAGMITDPSRKFLYLYSGNSVLIFSIAPDSGALISSGVAATNGSPDIPSNQALIFTPNGKFAFFITQDADTADPTAAGSVTRFSVDANTGALGAIETVSAQIQNPQAVAIDPSGKFLYISGLPADSANGAVSSVAQIAIFGVAPNSGTLTPLSSSPLSVQSGIVPTSMAVEATGHFIYAAGTDSKTNTAALSVFTINGSTGALTESLPPLPLGAAVPGISSIALSPSANFGYVLTIPIKFPGFVDQFVQLFQWDVQTGKPGIADALTENAISNPPMLPASALGLFSPDQFNAASAATTNQSVFLFFARTPSASISTYKMDAKSGAFTWLAELMSAISH